MAHSSSGARPWILGLVLAACGGAATPEPPPAAREARPWRPLRAPELAEARAALERGRGDRARRLLERLPGFEAELLRARAELQCGDVVACLAALERARALDPEHPELCAAEVECLAALDRVPSATEQLAAGFARCGPAPALLRAQGVLELRRPGHGEAALQALQRARAADPELPFLARPLAQAHLLAGRGLLERRPAEATAHAMAALGLVPAEDVVYEEALELEAEGLAAEQRFEEALLRQEELARRGRDTRAARALLHQRAGTRSLLERQRAVALEHYLAARALGMDDEGLGFGAELLAEERGAAIRRGMSAAGSEDWSGARAAFERALELDPDDPELENHLAAACFHQEDFRAAAGTWERALAHAAEAGVELRDPVPLDLARAWRLAGEPERARAVLARLLDAEPKGPWSAEARELLWRLEAEALAER